MTQFGHKKCHQASIQPHAFVKITSIMIKLVILTNKLKVKHTHTRTPSVVYVPKCRFLSKRQKRENQYFADKT
jgi:hypothetical protein